MLLLLSSAWLTAGVCVGDSAGDAGGEPSRATGAAATTESRLWLEGSLDLGTTVGGGGGERLNTLIRGDSNFDDIRLRLFLDVEVTPRLTLFNQFMIDPSVEVFPESFLRSYARWEAASWDGGEVLLQAGKIPTPFGSFAPRAYSDRNPLIGTPLLYHYFTALRANQLPADNRDLLAHRGEGQPADFGGFAGGGAERPFSGLPLIYDACWDVGIAAIGSAGPWEYQLAVTRGTLSSPRFRGDDNNDGEQLALRLAWVAAPGLLIGSSWARGPYLDRAVEPAVRARGAALEDFEQQIWGLDVDYGVGHLRVVAELAQNRWQVPTIRAAGGGLEPLEVVGGYLEARYAIRAGLWGGLRYDRLDFGRIDDGTGGGRRTPWEADVERWEAGVGYAFTDRVLGKLVWQQTRRSAPAALDDGFLAVQLTSTFGGVRP